MLGAEHVDASRLINQWTIEHEDPGWLVSDALPRSWKRQHLVRCATCLTVFVVSCPLFVGGGGGGGGGYLCLFSINPDGQDIHHAREQSEVRAMLLMLLTLLI